VGSRAVDTDAMSDDANGGVDARREPLFPGARAKTRANNALSTVQTPFGTLDVGGDARAFREREIDDELNAREKRANGQAEVYCVSRPFKEWGRGFFAKLPSGAREALQTAGVAHFMLVYRDVRTGEMRQFDFGPVGGDMHDRWLALAGGKTLRSSEQGARETVYAMMKGQVGKHRARRKRSCVQGEIRESVLKQLPDKSYLVGTTHLSLDDIRGFNGARDLMYELHTNDCRHYLNDLSYYLCREQAVSSKYIKDLVIKRIRQQGNIWEHHLWLTHAISDVENVERWAQAGRAAGATLMFGLGARLLPFAAPAKRLVTWGSGALASTSEDVPIVREVLGFGGFLLDSGRSAVGLLFAAHGAVSNAVVQVGKGVTTQLEREILPSTVRAAANNTRRTRGIAGTKRPMFSPTLGIRVSPSSISLPSVAVGAANFTQGFFRSQARAINGLGRNFGETIRRFTPGNKINAQAV